MKPGERSPFQPDDELMPAAAGTEKPADKPADKPAEKKADKPAAAPQPDRRPDSGADSLNRWDSMLTRTMTGRLCSVDTVTMVDAPSRMMTGIVMLGEFVPYRRADD